MKISITKSFKVNLGNYESEEISATVTVDTEDLYGPDPDAVPPPTEADEHVQELQDFATKHVQKWIDAQLEEAAELSQAKDSILPEPQPKTAPPRRERTKSTTTRSTR